MRFLALFLGLFSLYSCSSDTVTTVSTLIVYTSDVAFFTGDSASQKLNDTYIKQTTTDSAFKVSSLVYSDIFTSSKSIASNSEYFLALNGANLITTGTKDGGNLDFNAPVAFTTDTVFDIAVDRYNYFYLATATALYQYKCTDLLPSDTIALIADKITTFGDSIYTEKSGAISLYEVSAEKVVKTYTATKGISDFVANSTMLYYLAVDSNIYSINLATGVETPVTSTSDYVAMTLSDEALIMATSSIITSSVSKLKYNAFGSVKDIKATNDVIISYEVDSLGANALQVVDAETMRYIITQPIEEATVILEK